MQIPKLLELLKVSTSWKIFNPTIKNPSFYAIQFRINILLKSFPILFILIYFINFHPYFNS